MKTATENAVLAAYSKTVRKLERDATLRASATSAGFVIPNGQKRGRRKGYQVFVKVCRFDEELLKSNPLTDGLLDT